MKLRAASDAPCISLARSSLLILHRFYFLRMFLDELGFLLGLFLVELTLIVGASFLVLLVLADKIVHV